MADLQDGRPKIDLREQPTVECESCKNIYFKEVTILKKVSKFMTGSSDDTIVPFPTYMCEKCGHVNEELKIFDSPKPTE